MEIISAERAVVSIDHGFNDYVPAALIFVSTIVVITYLSFFTIKEGDLAAVVFTPWTSNEEALSTVLTSGSLPIRYGTVGTIIVVKLENLIGLDRLRSNGAWFSVNARALGACIPGIASPITPE